MAKAMQYPSPTRPLKGGTLDSVALSLAYDGTKMPGVKGRPSSGGNGWSEYPRQVR